MRYFTYIAEQSFKTDEEGRRVFYLGNPMSRPYVIPDAATESRMFRKLTWFHRVFLTALFVALLFIIQRIIDQPLRFFVFFGAITALQWVTLRIIFFNDLRTLPRTGVRPTLKTFYTKTAERHSVRALKWGLFGSLAFMLVGVADVVVDSSQLAIGATCVVMFGVFAVAWAYMLKLKLAQKAAVGGAANN